MLRLARPLPASHRAAAVPTRRRTLTARATPISLTLVPTGDGSTDHLDGPCPLPLPIPLSEGLYELGREDPADIVVSIPTVSTRHAMLRVGPAGGPPNTLLTLTDLGSTNGTYVGTGESATQLKAMAAVPVPPGEEIVFGDMFLAKFKVVAGDGTGGGSAAAA